MSTNVRPWLLALTLIVPGSATSAEVAWRFFSQLPLSIDGLPVFADLDGNGFNEIVFGTRAEIAIGWTGYGLTVLAQVDGALDRVVSIGLPQTPYSLVSVRRPGQADAVLLTVGHSGSTRLMELTGPELELLRNVVVPDRTRLHLVADIDADGELEILADTSASAGPEFPMVLDYATATVQWQGPVQTDGMAAAQLDADPALEIITRGGTGRIYDGATGQQEWAWPGGFGQSVVGGRFEVDPEIPGFVSSTTVFRASPYSPLREFPGTGLALTAFDADNDGRDELYASRQSGFDFIRISAVDGSIESLLPLGSAARPPRLARLQAGGSTVAALGTLGYSLSQAGAMTVFDLDAAQVRYQANYSKAPWWPSAFLQPQPPGPLAVASLVGRLPSDSKQYQVDLVLRDAASGAEVATRPDVFPQGSDLVTALPMVADIDGTPGDEIIVLGTGSGSSYSTVALLDGSTLQDRWRVGGSGSPLDFSRLRGWALVDRNQDGVGDVVLAESRGFGGGVRVVVLSGADGSELWRSVNLWDPNVSERVGLVAGEIDAQPGSEIVLAASTALYAFDAKSGLVTWIVKASGQEVFTDVVHWGTGEDCRIGLVMHPQTLRLLSCVDRQTLDEFSLPAGSERVAPLDDQGRALAVLADGGLLVSRDGGPFEPVATNLGAGLQLNWPWAVRASSGSMSALLGSSLQLLRMDLDLDVDRLFASDFELQP